MCMKKFNYQDIEVVKTKIYKILKEHNKKYNN